MSWGWHYLSSEGIDIRTLPKELPWIYWIGPFMFPSYRSMDDIYCKIWLRTKGSYHPFGCSPYTVMTKAYIKLCTLRERKSLVLLVLIECLSRFTVHFALVVVESWSYSYLVLGLSHHVLSLLSHWDLWYHWFLQQGLSPLWSNFLLLPAGLSLRFSFVISLHDFTSASCSFHGLIFTSVNCSFTIYDLFIHTLSFIYVISSFIMGWAWSLHFLYLCLIL